MGGSSGQTPAVTTQTKDPWSAAQPYLTSAMGQAASLNASNLGYQPYTGQTQAPLSYESQVGMFLQSEMDRQSPNGFPSTQAALTNAQNVIENQGITPGVRGAINNIGNTADQFNTLYNQASTPDNPYLQSQLDAQNRLIGDKVNAATSGMGRYGSAAHTDVLARALSETDAPVLAQDFARRQQEMLAATQGAQGAYGQQAGLYQQGLSQAGQYSQLLPSLQQLQYLPAQNMMALGSIYDQRNQSQLNDQIKLYNAQQAYPWEELSRFNAVLQGTGALGGSQVTSSTPYQAPFAQRLLGGAVAGGGLGSIFGAPGAAVGALGGAALGGFS